MAYPPVPISPAGGASRLPVLLPRRRPFVLEPVSQTPETASAFAELREQITSGTQEVNALLSAIAKAAETLTGASGAAIALGHDGVVLCVGRSGETAPELGARVSVDSGISGECLSCGETLRCDDTQMDPRVDAAVCRRLGLRSLVAVPLSGADGMVGVLEAFSIYPGTFTRGHMEILEGLAELVELAHAHVSAAATTAGPELVASTASATEFPLAEDSELDNLRESLHATEEQPRRMVWMIAPALATLAIISWMVWSRTVGRPVQAQKPASVRAEPQGESVAEITLKPTPVRLVRPARTRMTTLKPAAVEEDIQDVVVRDMSAKRTPAQPASTSDESPDNQLIPVPQEQIVSEPPAVVALAPTNAGLENVAAVPAPAPKLQPVISQGVVRGALEHRVQPTYPQQARTMRLAGTVVLRAMVSEVGDIQEVKLVDGNTILGRAATEAVKQWRYRPSTLNGKPVKVETLVTINFTAP